MFTSNCISFSSHEKSRILLIRTWRILIECDIVRNCFIFCNNHENWIAFFFASSPLLGNTQRNAFTHEHIAIYLIMILCWNGRAHPFDARSHILDARRFSSICFKWFHLLLTEFYWFCWVACALWIIIISWLNFENWIHTHWNPSGKPLCTEFSAVHCLCSLSCETLCLLFQLHCILDAS